MGQRGSKATVASLRALKWVGRRGPDRSYGLGVAALVVGAPASLLMCFTRPLSQSHCPSRRIGFGCQAQLQIRRHLLPMLTTLSM
jgi:hypothetical protein